MSKHIVWMCHKKPKSAREISEELNIPMPYVEEELEILTNGANNEYGLLREMGNGRYGINFSLFDTKQVSELHKVYEEKISEVAKIIMSHFDRYKDEYMAKPYLNHKVPFEYIIWQNCMDIIFRFGNRIVEAIGEKHFSDIDTKHIPEESREDIAKAIECGYLYREDDKIYTKILVMDVTDIKDEDELFSINSKCFEHNESIIDVIADEIGVLLKKMLPEYLHNEYAYGNSVAGLPLIDGVYNELINNNYITVPENGIGAEGCWMFVDKGILL